MPKKLIGETSEYILTEYTQEEYEEDMRLLLQDKGLSGAVVVFTDKINDETIGLGYVTRRSIQEWLADILWLCKKFEEPLKGFKIRKR